jgi:tetratricopeptide (TPR) repeat protein
MRSRAIEKLMLAVCFAACAVLTPSAWTQIPTIGGTANGQILVRVKDSDGSPMSLPARVTLRSSSQLTNVTTSTSDAGQALFTGLAVGDYTVEVSAPGYKTAEQQATIAASGLTEYVEVVLTPGEGGKSAGNKVAPGPGAVLAPKALKETEKGVEALKNGKLDEAEAHLKRALQLAPGFPDVNYLMGLLWLQKHDAAKAQGYLEKTVSLAPKHAAALQALGEVYLTQKAYPRAAEVLEQSLAQKPAAWRARILAATAYYQEGQYAKAKEQAAEALRSGQDQASLAHFLQGAAEAALGEKEAARSSLEKYIGSNPNGPQVETARQLIARLREPEPGDAAERAADGKASRIEPVVGFAPLPPATETNWAPPDVDQEKLGVEPESSCRVQDVAADAGQRVEQLVRNVDRFTATEQMEHESVSPMGVVSARESRNFNYLVAIRRIGPRQLNVEEYRDGSVSMNGFPAHLGTVGLPILVLVFHPYYRQEFAFHCEGRTEWQGRPTWRVYFRQRDDQMAEMRVFHVQGRAFPIHLKGRAWIDVETSQVLAMEADMVKPVPEVQLVRDHQFIEYGAVTFQKSDVQLWLPKTADWYCQIAGRRYHRRHTFSHFLLFSVDETQKIGRPKDADQPD